MQSGCQRLPFRKATKILVGQVSLFTWCIGTYRAKAICVSILSTPTVPANMLTGYAHPNVIAVKAVQVLQMLEHDITDLLQPGRVKRGSGAKEMIDFAEKPGSALSGAADHYAVGTGCGDYLFRFFRRVDVAVGKYRDRYPCLYRADRVVFGGPVITALSGSAVNGDCLDSGFLGNARDALAVARIN